MNRNWFTDFIACALLGMFFAAVTMGIVWFCDAITRATGLGPFWAFTLFYTAVLGLLVMGD